MEKKTIPVAANSSKEEALDFEVIDRRPFANLENLPSQIDEDQKPRYPTFVEELLGKLEMVERRFEEKKKQIDSEIARTKARLEADYERNLELEKQKIVLPFLEVLDNLERAVRAAEGEISEQLLEGVRMTVNLFLAKLQAIGVEAVTVLNQPFDPNLGQAVGTVEVTDERSDGLVLDEVLRGYRMGERLLRPAQVRVGIKN